MNHAILKKCQTYAKALRDAAGAQLTPTGQARVEAQIRNAVDALEVKLISEAQANAAIEHAAPDMTKRQLAAADLDRASHGLGPLVQAEDLPALMSEVEIQNLNFDRSHDGLEPLTASQIQTMQIRRTSGAPVEREHARKGMHPRALELENARRDLDGRPRLLPYGADDEE